jgi:replication factor C subunit 2/4
MQTPQSSKLLPWVEKYRPKKLDDIVQQNEIVQVLKKSITSSNLPHLLFYGPSGSGKTSTILAIARELYGPELMKERVIELNASDERGIGVVRNKIKAFAKSAIGTPDPKYPCPPYKIIILDEADSMTTEAQSALRKTMEANSKVTRFCFICNYINQIIEPIASRCAKFRFKSLEMGEVVKKLELIAESEKIRLKPEIFEVITEISEGDMRKAIMYLQFTKYQKKITYDITDIDIYEVAGVIPQKLLISVLDMCQSKDAKKLSKVIDKTKMLFCSGYPVHGIFEKTVKLIVDANLTDEQKSKICMQIANAEKKLLDGADEYLQMLDVFGFITITTS